MSTLIPTYTGILDDIHITTLVGEVWRIPLTDEAAFVRQEGGIFGVTLPVSFKTQRDQAYAAIEDREAEKNLEARVLTLIEQWVALPPAGSVVTEVEGRTSEMNVSAARVQLRKSLSNIYGIYNTDLSGDERTAGL